MTDRSTKMMSTSSSRYCHTSSVQKRTCQCDESNASLHHPCTESIYKVINKRKSSKLKNLETRFLRTLRFQNCDYYCRTLAILFIVTSLVDCQTTNKLSENQGCPYPGVGPNCQVNIVSQAPAVPLLSTEYIADEFATLKPDTQASYKCDQGYELLGQELLTCQANGRWSGPPPNCVTNVAIGKPTNQSSTVKGGDSRNANDGRLITQHDSKYCTETRVDQSPWWQIDLLQLYEIRSVRLLGRACCNPQLSLHDIEIRIGNSSGLQGNRLCAWYPNNLDEGVARDFQCAHPIVGRYVSIQMVGIESALSLCEVLVFSTKEFPSDRCNIQTTLAPTINNKLQTTTAATTSSITNVGENQPIVFNRTCYEMQASTGGSFLVADTYCKARGGSLLHSINNLTHAFISQELERLRARLKSKLVWLGARRETSSSNSLGTITSGSTSALIASDEPVLPPAPGYGLTASLVESKSGSLMSGEQGLSLSGEYSPIFSSLIGARTSLYQVSSGAGGSTSRGSQTFGLATAGTQHQHIGLNRSSERSLIISQPNQVASFFTPPVPITPANLNSPQPQTSSILQQQSPTPHIHRTLRPPSLVSQSSTSSAAISPPSQQNQQVGWSQSALSTSSSTSLSLASSGIQSPLSSGGPSSWRWTGDSQSESLLSPINNFLWADDQPNNYNNQQDCIVMDGNKKWLWNDVTCELDYLPWVCQYRPSSCGSPDRNENSTIMDQLSPDVGTTQEPAFQFGKTITYACPVGHRLEGPRVRKCQYDGTWSGRAPKCHYVNCGPVSSSSQSLENGRIVYLNQSQTTFGSQVKYICFEDYVLVGNDLRQCRADGKWDGKQPYCAYKWCPVLNQIPNGFLNVSSYSENSIASYQCNSGYKLIGNDTRQCLLGGKWTNQEPFCQYVDCGQPKSIPNGNYQLLNSTTNYLSVATYSCNSNYTLVGGTANKLICSANNRWTGREAQCSLIDCGQPQANPGSSFSGTSFTVHSTVEYKCDPGFKEVSGSTQRTCASDGQWTGSAISCKYVDCGRVPAILKGEVNYVNGTTYLASQVAYECTPGNRLSGHRIRFCGPDGRWTGSSPKCEEVRCDAPRLPANGSAIYIGNDRSFKEQSFSVGVTVQYECDYGHVVRGTWSSRLCQANGEWSGEAPVCKFVDCGQPPAIENGSYQLKHPPAGSVGSASLVPAESTRRSDPPNAAVAGTFTYYGTIAHYSCDMNFKLQGQAQRECLDSGQWRLPIPTCEPVQCPKPEYFDEFTQVSLVARGTQDSEQVARSVRLISNNQWINQHDSAANGQQQQFGVGDKLYYSCAPGYELYGGPEIRTCTQYGQWSGSSTPRCRLIDCGRPAPIGQEGRFYLLNESTTFNSLVEYSCVRPFKLVEVKIRQSGNLIETLNAAQAGVTPILTSLPIGVKVCANNGQWMPNDQLAKCVSAGDPTAIGAGHFDGIDNTLDGSQRGHHLSGANSNQHPTFAHDDGSNHLEQTNASGHQQTPTASQQATSLWAKIIIAICLMVMLALIILTLICIKSSKKPKQQNSQARNSIMSTNVGGSAAVAAAMQLQMATNGGKSLQQQQQAAAAAALAAAQQAGLVSSQNIYMNGLTAPNKMFANGAISHMNQSVMSPGGGITVPYGDASMTMNRTNQAGLMLAARSAAALQADAMSNMANNPASAITMARQTNEINGGSAAIDSYSRLGITDIQQANKTIRHNPTGLVTFVSPQQQTQQQPQSKMTRTPGQQVAPGATAQQKQVSPQSISTSLSLSSSSSPSSSTSSSAHHTTATRLSSTTDSASSSSSSSNSNGQLNQLQLQNIYHSAVVGASRSPPPQHSPPSLPAHPPPPHRLQHHHKQLQKQQQQLQHHNQQQQNPPTSTASSQQLNTMPANSSNHHYMEPNI